MVAFFLSDDAALADVSEDAAAAVEEER